MYIQNWFMQSVCRRYFVLLLSLYLPHFTHTCLQINLFSCCFQSKYNKSNKLHFLCQLDFPPTLLHIFACVSVCLFICICVYAFAVMLVSRSYNSWL